jgi:hypothetical protein
VNHLEADTI